MFPRSTATYLRVLCVLFLMCPKRTRPYAVLSARQEHPAVITSKYTNLLDTSVLQNFNAPKILRSSDGTEIVYDESEINIPGFDFTDEEMKKLKLWNQGVVPYYIDLLSFADKVLRDRIRLFLNGVSSITSLSFVELPRPPDDYDNLRWVFFLNRRGLLGCADNPIKHFTNTGAQRVVLGYDCVSTGGGIADAVLAIAGVPPQHNAPDRDKYIEILYENILPGKTYLFDKLQDNEWLFHDIPYDFESAGHIQYHKHSANGHATFKTKIPYHKTFIGNTHGFSHTDILKIRALYNYISKTTGVISGCGKLFSQGKNNGSQAFNVTDITSIRPKPNKYLGLKAENNTILGSSNELAVETERIQSDSINVDKESDSNQRYECKNNNSKSFDREFNIDNFISSKETYEYQGNAEETSKILDNENYENDLTKEENKIDCCLHKASCPECKQKTGERGQNDNSSNDMKFPTYSNNKFVSTIKKESLKLNANDVFESLSDYNTDDEDKRILSKRGY